MQVRLTGIRRRRHGFLWLRESPAFGRFEVRGSPGEQYYQQEIRLNGSMRLPIGPHQLAMRFLGGSFSMISLAIGQLPSGPLPESQ